MKKLSVNHIAQLMKQYPPPFGLILIGPPCVGKSTFISQLQELIPDRIHLASHDSILDAWALANGKKYSDAFKGLNFKLVKQEMRAKAAQAVANREFIAFDQVNMKMKTRRVNLDLLRIAQPRYTTFAITFPYDEKMLLARNKARSLVGPLYKYIPEHIIKSMMQDYASPHPFENYSEVIELIPRKDPLFAR